MNFKFSLLLIITLFYSNMHAQNTIKGTVKDNELQTLPNVSVYIKGSNFYSITDIDGKYEIYNIPDGSYDLIIKTIGYEEKIIPIILKKNTILTKNISLEEGNKLDEILINARIEGQAKALNAQKNRNNIVSIISKEQIERFPDANIGDALKRMSGINVQYDQGEARFANIRGTAPELNSITINGERIPSAEADKRSVQLDLIPADMIETVEVNKAITPDMDADAIGGSINLRTKKASSKEHLSGTIGSGYSVLANKPIYKGKLFYSNRFNDNKIGLILNTSILDKQVRSDNIEATWGYLDENHKESSTYTSEMQIRQYYLERLRQSYNAMLDFDLDQNNNIYISTNYNWRNDWENRYRLKYKKIKEDNGEYKTEIRRQTKGGSHNNKNRRLEDQRVLSIGIGGNHEINKFKINWTLSRNIATEERPNERYISFKNKNEVINLDLTNLRKPKITPLNEAALDLSDDYDLKEISEEFKYTKERDINTRFDFQLPILNGKYTSVLKFGTKYKGKSKERNNTFKTYEPVNEDDFKVLALQNISSQTNTNFNAGDYQIGSFVNPEFLGNLNLNDENLFNNEIVLEELAGNFNATEKVTAYYVMYTQNIGSKFNFITGLRYEGTNLTYEGKIYDGNTLINSEKEKNNYYNILPALHLKYKLTKNTNIRLAYTNSLARPNYFDLVPYQQIDTEDNRIKIGNPNLIATTSTNFDLLGEYFFKNVGLISGGIFYKNLSNVIADKILNNYTYNGTLYDRFTQPINTGDAYIFGVEIDLQYRLKFLPGILKNVSVIGNYTYTKSELKNITLNNREDEVLPLSGTPKNIYNISLAYDTKKIDVRVSFNFADKFIEEYGAEEFFDRWYDTVNYLDINANYKLSKQWKIYASANNLLNQPLRYYQGVEDRTMQAEYYGVQTKLGVKFKF